MVSPGLQQGEIDRLIGLAARMRLNVGIGTAEQRLGALDGECFNRINMRAAAVITSARIAFRIFVGQYRPLYLQYGATHEVFRSNQLDRVALPLVLAQDVARHVRIGFGKRP
jgi:hypothetical protein